MTVDAAANTSLNFNVEQQHAAPVAGIVVNLKEVESLEKKNTKLENDLKFKTSKNIELYQRVFWLEAQLKRQLEHNTGIPNNVSPLATNPSALADVSMVSSNG